MDIRVTFKTIEDKNDFATRWNIAFDGEEKYLDLPWELLGQAKKCTRTSSIVQLDAVKEHVFIVNGKLSAIELLATVIKDMGGDWYLVKTKKAIALSKKVKSIDVNDHPIKFLGNVVTLNDFNGTEPTVIDPTLPEAQWARIRIASTYRPLSTNYTLHDITYQVKPEIYVMDSGINFDHEEFDDPNLEKIDFWTAFGDNFADDLGHGTAVAACAVGKYMGITSYAKIMNMKIGGGDTEGNAYSVSLLQLGEAIDAILTEVQSSPLTTRIVNMSWGVSQSDWLDSKVQSLIDAGVTVVCAAGNSGISVDDISPAGIPAAITVGAIDKFDIPAGFNNISPSDSGLTTAYGLSLDIFAPGDNVVIADHSHLNGYLVASGTSFSSPYVAGVAAQIAAINDTPVLHTQLKEIIMNTAIEHALLFEDDRFSENQNRLLHVITADSLAEYKNTNAVSYLGVHEDDSAIVADLNSSLNVTDFIAIFPDDAFSYSVIVDDDNKEYAKFIKCDPVTGLLTIDKPDIELPDDIVLQMVSFIGIAENAKVKITSNTIFFFYNNPLYDDNVDSDITLALSEVNSISFFAFWSVFLK